MGLPSDTAANIPAPKVGDINVLAVSDIVSAAIDTGIAQGVQWYTFSADVDVFFTFGPANAETDPSPTGVGGDSQAWVIYANTERDYQVNLSRRFFKAICNATQTGFLRYRRSQ